jgi:hypothetical protein
MKNKKYWGIATVTYKEDELKTLIEKIVYPIPEDIKYFNLFSEESTQNNLTMKDKTALVKYVPILFDVFTGRNIEDAIFRLVKAVWNYRLYQSPNYAINYVKDNNFTPYDGEPKGKLKSFYGHIDSIIELMAGNFSSGTPKDQNMPTPAELKAMLKYAKEHSEIYLPSKPKVSANQNIFKDYLRGLKLYDKSKKIEAFAKSIK